MGSIKKFLFQCQLPDRETNNSRLFTDFRPSGDTVKRLKKQYEEEGRFFPVLLNTEHDSTHMIIDGHHRIYMPLELGLLHIDGIVTDIPWETTEKLRTSDSLLKEYDWETGFKYNWSNILKMYAAYTLNRYYRGTYSDLLRKQGLYYRVGRKIKRLIFGKRHVFKTFYEAYNQ